MANNFEKITWLYMNEDTPTADLTGYVCIFGKNRSVDIMSNYKGTWSANLDNVRVLDQYSYSREETVLALEEHIDNL
jgi:hypothetical protein